jgi:3-hydroxyacyl-CoA dehydrogenase
MENSLAVDYQLQENIGVIRVNNPPVNAMSQAVRMGIKQAVVEAQSDNCQAILLLCEGRTFIAGADIKEFGKPALDPSLSDLLATIEQSRKLIIAAIHGTALGGGFELALTCHYRCAISSAKVGLPEVKLGLLPGAGGTQRASRLAGVEAALDLISNGNPISASKALTLNLIDTILEGDLAEASIAYAQKLVADFAPIKRVSDINIEKDSIPTGFLDDARARFEKRFRGQLALQNIVSCMEAAIELPFDEGLRKERQLFVECMQSDASAAMRHLFFAERSAAKVKALDRSICAREIHTVGIIGGGTMGGGIAMNFANAGIPVILIEVDDCGVNRALKIVERNYGITVSKGKLSEEQKDHCLSLISGTTKYEELGDVDLVIEAVYENLDLKKKIFGRLDEVCRPGTILATNTSYQDIDLIASATGRPEDVIGMHFFSPANVMKLLEVVRGSKTADDVISSAMGVAKIIKKIPVLSGNCYGFIGNRMLRSYVSETQSCLIEGAAPEQIDGVMENFGMAMGPLAVGDLAGLDIGYTARKALSQEKKGAPKTYCIADALVEMGRLGQKSGSGYYLYDPETRGRMNDPEVLTVMQQQAEKLGIIRKPISDEDVLNRLVFSLINEGAKLLEEGIAQRSSDIDVVYVFGYGFPKFRGGPMQYADTVGLKKVCHIIDEFYNQYETPNWECARLLKSLATKELNFSAYT